MTQLVNSTRQTLSRVALAALTVLALVAAVVGYVWPQTAPTSTRVYLRSGSGSVLFTHGAHGDRAGACVRCHHELAGAVSTGCDECHEDEMDADDFDHADLVAVDDHECAGCHDVAAAATARGCRTCHPSAAPTERPFVGCATCHPDEDYALDDMSHGELLEIEDHSCDGCHRPVAVADAYHRQCNGCHLAAAPERFGDGDGKAKCTTCHLR